jgi:DNA/RNA-binding domain of Phe-tRNA-synthetase-like protein
MTQNGLDIDPELSDRLRVGGLVQEGIQATPDRGAALDAAIGEAERDMRALYCGLQPSEIPGLKPARRLFKSIGVDPTRMRPASEALLRRVLKGGGIPSINSAVDATNLISLQHLTPVGLYNRDRIDGAVLLRLGRAGEDYQRIGKGVLHLERRIGLFDGRGGFGNPTGDSRRTSVDAHTKNLLFVAFFPADSDPLEIAGMVRDAGEKLTLFTGGETALLGEDGVIHGG